MLLQNSEVLADAERTAAEGYAPLKRALARFQQLLREEGRDTAPAPESSRWLLADQTKTQEPAAAQPAPQPQPEPEPEPEPEPLPSGLTAHHDRQPQISAFADSFASDPDSGGIEGLPQLTGRPVPQQSRIVGVINPTSSPPPPAEVLERPEQPGAAGRRTPKPQRQHQPGMGEGGGEPSAGNNAMAAVFGWQW